MPNFDRYRVADPAEGRACGGRSWGVWLPILTLVFSGCDDILSVDLPTRVPAESLQDPALASTLVLGAQADFECAFAEFIVATGGWAHEFQNATGWREGTVWTQRLGADYDGGTTNCPTTLGARGFGVYLPLQLARNQAETAFTLIEGFEPAAVPNRTALMARAAAYGGYATTLLGEVYCEMSLDGETIITPEAVLADAERTFTTAIELAAQAGEDDILHLATLGRARVRMDLGRAAEAAADAATIPEGFEYMATYATSVPRRINHVYLKVNVNHILSVDPRYRDLEVEGVPDPRVPVRDIGVLGHDAITPMWVQEKYDGSDAGIPMATWREAQLIIAEALGGPEAVAAINRLRDHWGLPHFSSSDPSEIRDQIIEERRRELFLEGHRLSDHLRFGIPFDSGVNHKGVAYADEFTCLPLPRAEL